VIRVEDDGQGVAAEDVATVLERFGQARPSEGSGLGLSIAEAVAQSHGGSILLDRSETGGLSVAIRLPLAVADQVALALTQGPATAQAAE
jgi:signal transduction histidine kinase